MAFSSVTVHDVPAGAQLIDVREVDEYTSGHAVGAVNIPMGEIPSRLSELDQSKDLYIICQAGGRSARICDYLDAQGIESINVDGGTGAWAAAGLPME